MSEELNASRTKMTEARNENVKLHQWQQQMMAWQEQMDRQMMVMQQSGLWSQPRSSTQSGPRNQFNNGQNDDCNDDDTYNDENDC